MSHWTTNGWTICLGAGWEVSWWDETRYTGKDGPGRRDGLDFYEESEAKRAAGSDCSYYDNVIILECLADIFGETVEEDFVSGKLWRSLSIAQRKMLAAKATKVKQEDVSQSSDFSESLDHTHKNYGSSSVTFQDDGSIIIPAASFIDPSKPNDKVLVMDSFLGGMQLHLEHDGEVEYEIPTDVKGGTYVMSLKVVNIHRNQQPIIVTIDDSSSTTPYRPDGFEIVHSPQQKLEVQYTMGRWQMTDGKVQIDISPGTKLKLRREDPCWGLTIKEILLQPM